MFSMDLLCVLLIFLRAHEHIYFYGKCTVTKCIIAIVNGTLCYILLLKCITITVLLLVFLHIRCSVNVNEGV